MCSVVTVLFTEPLKYLFGRRRPAEEDITRRVVPLRKDVSNPAFPSGDSAQVTNSLQVFIIRLLSLVVFCIQFLVISFSFCYHYLQCLLEFTSVLIGSVILWEDMRLV